MNLSEDEIIYLPLEFGFNPVIVVLNFSSINDMVGVIERDTILRPLIHDTEQITIT